MLQRQIERVLRSQACSNLVVATSKDESDDVVENFCSQMQVACFRGSLDDVLDRFYKASLEYEPDIIVRLTGDCPLSDPDLIDKVVNFHVAGGFDYSSNTLLPTYPDGLDVEVFNFPALYQAWRDASTRPQREHVTPFIHEQPTLFQLGSFEGPVDLSELRWTVDEPADFEVVESIYAGLLHRNCDFSTEDVLNFLETRPELKTLNSKHRRNEGYALSLSIEERGPS